VNTEELVRTWKDPDSRTGELSFHPAGRIELDPFGGKDAGNTISTISTATILTTTSTGPCTISVTTITTTVTAAPVTAPIGQP
jgi:hypothetical protein